MKKQIPILPGEHWWGGTTMHAYCPISAQSDYHQDFRKSAPNQTMPLFVSDHGRYIWSDEPFKADICGGIITLEGGEILLNEDGGTLRDAYCAAQKAHFPCDKKELEPVFFRVPQYNSWIEFTYYPTQEGILRYAREIIDHGFAPGIFIIDEGWHCHTGYGKWEFDLARFPDPKAMVAELHSLGFYVMLWITPFVTPVGPDYFRSLHALVGTDPLSAKHLYKRTESGEVALIKWWNGISAILDFTNPYDCDFMEKQLRRLMEEYGVDGFKFDGGALQHYTDDNVINGTFAKGHTPAQCNAAWNAFGSRFPFHEYKDTYMGGGKNTIQRLHDRDHSWTGNGINELIPCALTKGLIGHPFTCPDMVGGGEWSNRYTPGFEVDEELFVRMAQCSALFPMIQFSWAPWNALSPENTALCKGAADLHAAMAPDIEALVKEASLTGEPIIRALEYNDPHQGFAGIVDQFMLGTDILVAPVVSKGIRRREVAFPAGIWEDEEGNRFCGRSRRVLDAPLEKLLWFRRVQ